MHCRTLVTLNHAKNNAVLLLHGTTGSSLQSLAPSTSNKGSLHHETNGRSIRLSSHTSYQAQPGLCNLPTVGRRRATAYPRGSQTQVQAQCFSLQAFLVPKGGAECSLKSEPKYNLEGRADKPGPSVPSETLYLLRLVCVLAGKHGVSVGGVFGNGLNDVPVFHDLAISYSEDVDDRFPSVFGAGCELGMHDDQVSL